MSEGRFAVNGRKFSIKIGVLLDRTFPEEWKSAMPIAPNATVRIAVDIGGTFTDVQILNEQTGAVFAHKTPTTPADPSVGLLTGMTEAADLFGFALSQVTMLIHGTTIATNAVLEQKLPAAALITTAGFEDVLEIGRHMRHDIYAGKAEDRILLIPRAQRIGVIERMRADGSVETPLCPDSLSEMVTRLTEMPVAAAAICCLHGHTNPAHEQQIAAHIRAALPDLHLSLSSEISPEFREYERSSTTALNALLMPVVGDYLARLESRLKAAGFDRPVYLVQSNGGIARPAVAAREPARLLLSGPSGGALAAETIAEQLDLANLVAVDMGGTSYDVSLVQNQRTRMISQGEVGGCPVRLPMVEMRTIGAGGGSLAEMDHVGALKVGPESAGAHPGPAAYGHGGSRPTVTDANVVLGRIAPKRFLGGSMTLDHAAAETAIAAHVGTPANLSTEAAANGVLTITVAHMASAIRLSLFEKGLDPADFALVAFGGAGGLHACETAADLGISNVVFPRDAGTLSAWGMLYADLRHDLIRACPMPADGAAMAPLERLLATMTEEATRRLDADGIPEDARSLEAALDLRYRGQAYEITTVLKSPADLTASVTQFHHDHAQQFAHSNPDVTPEIVNLRLTASGRLAKPQPTTHATAEATGDPEKLRIYLQAWQDVSVFARSELSSNPVTGPVIVEDPHATLFIPPDWQISAAVNGSLIATYQHTSETRHD
jgi:N-methylhydantoinase A